MTFYLVTILGDLHRTVTAECRGKYSYSAVNSPTGVIGASHPSASTFAASRAASCSTADATSSFGVLLVTKKSLSVIGRQRASRTTARAKTTRSKESRMSEFRVEILHDETIRA